jgi:hypothetical protein
MPTLTRLNFYFVIPAMVYGALVTSPLTGAQIGAVVLFSLLALVLQFVLTVLSAVVFGVPKDLRRALIMTTIFNNSGNYGFPMQDLAFRGPLSSTGANPASPPEAVPLNLQAMSLQVFVVIVQNISGFTLGVVLAAGGREGRHWRSIVREIARFPAIYVLMAALLTIQVRDWLGDDAPRVAEALRPFWIVIEYMRGAFIAVALCTLGAQLAVVRPAHRDYPVRLSVLLRLLAGPAAGLGLIYLLGLHGFLAQVLLLSTATPTAVNCALLCLEFDNHPDYAANAVFFSTLLSPLTVTLVIFLARGGLLAALTP